LSGNPPEIVPLCSSIDDDEQLKAWIQRAIKFVGKLAAKEK
jgi:hypothetical protein